MVNWINNTFGVNLSPTISFIVLFAAIILAVRLLIWLTRRLLGGTFINGGRGRHLRLAVIDATPVDSRRRLVLVRRDDVEHLILIGGPTDLVVEQNIRPDGPIAAKTNLPAQYAPAPTTRPSEPAPAPEPLHAEPARPIPVPQQTQRVMPVQQRPAQVPQRPAAPSLPPRPAPAPAQPAPQAARPPQVTITAPAAAAVVAAPRAPELASHVEPVAMPMAPRVEPERPVEPVRHFEPVAAPVTSRPDPQMSNTVPEQAVPQVVSRPVEMPISAEQAMDDSLLADISESLSLDDEEIGSNVSLEKEMESLLSTLDTQKDRIS
jgi:flagellar biogenesis protein FliO